MDTESDCTNTPPYSPVKAEIASSNLVGVANLIDEYGENKGGKMTRQLARQSITLDELETLRADNPHLLSGADQLMELVQEKLNDDLITLYDAEIEFGIIPSTLKSWMERHPDKLSPKKKINNYSSKGGRPRILISRSELQSFLENKRGRGRPSKVAV